MGQILGLGITHYPNLAADLNMSWRMQKSLDDPALPAALRAQGELASDDARAMGRRLRQGALRCPPPRHDRCSFA